MSRKKMKPKKDSKVFTRTAVKSKKVNLGLNFMRGGIRF